jgi:hypothetical protein
VKIIFDAAGLTPDATSIDRIAKLQVAARRAGAELSLRDPSDALCDLIAFVGLAEVLSVEPKRHAEEWKQRGRVEEERELDDPAT